MQGGQHPNMSTAWSCSKFPSVEVGNVDVQLETTLRVSVSHIRKLFFFLFLKLTMALFVLEMSAKTTC